MKKAGIICNLMTGYGGVQTCVISLIKGLNEIKVVPHLISNTTPNENILVENNLQVINISVDFSLSAKFFNKYRKILRPIQEFIYFFKTSWLEEEYDFIYIFQPNIIVDNSVEHLYYLSMSPVGGTYSSTPILSRIKFSLYKIFLKKNSPGF